jgi:LPXTG-motif cell wall-anchored protein
MTFLPKTAEARQELLTLLIAIPLSLVGTSFFFFLLEAGSRAAAI